MINPKNPQFSFDTLDFRRREGVGTANRQVEPAAEDANYSEVLPCALIVLPCAKNTFKFF